ncbi:hypothetical protein TcWFU_000519 [Taenia crassiceps]|uniref:Uncharacterized protein n=1 Tax=Taenia crassiceps TaxID=6207 RepID=A0ABR4QF59_9CEST
MYSSITYFGIERQLQNNSTSNSPIPKKVFVLTSSNGNAQCLPKTRLEDEEIRCRILPIDGQHMLLSLVEQVTTLCLFRVALLLS